MDLGTLIQELEKADPEQVCAEGFCSPHSYRGYYHELAFEPAKDVTVKDMLAAAKSALGSTYTGYKGGSYRMDGYSTVYLARYGDCGEELTSMALKYMLHQCEDK